MSDSLNCPNCGAELPADAPAGLCPKCLVAAGFESEAGAESARPKSDPEAPTIDSPASSFAPPEVAALADKFPQLEILDLLGHGGMGAVYKARQTNLDRLVALKIIRPEANQDSTFAERFNREARTLARLSHQSIVAVHDFGEIEYSEAENQPDRPLYYFLMEYVDGANLRQLMRSGALTPEQALAIVPQICDALQYAHDEGVVHRDIKPENILLDKRGRVKIADFGLAKLANGAEEEFTLTGTHQVMGTLRYMAPEQMEGSRNVDHRADIYSLGVVFYEMLTGEAPMGHFDPPSKKVEIDVRLDEVVLRAMAREPERRYQHASDVKTDLESVSAAPNPQVAQEVSRVYSAVGPISSGRSEFTSDGTGSAIGNYLSTITSWIIIAAAVCLLSILFPWKEVSYESDLQSTTAIAHGYQLWTGWIAAGLAGLLIVVLSVDGVLKRPVALWRPVLAVVIGLILMPLIGEEISNDSAYGQPRDAKLLIANPPDLWGVTEEQKQEFSLFLRESAESNREISILNHELSGGIVAFVAAFCLFLTGMLQLLALGYSRIAGQSPAKHLIEKQSSPADNLPLELTRRPFGSVFAVMVVFGTGWLGIGALRNFGPAGFVLGSVAMGLVALAVLKWTYSFVPALRDELNKRTRGQRWGALVAAAILFGLAMLALEYANVLALDGWYYSRVSADAQKPLASLAELFDEKLIEELAIPPDMVTSLDSEIMLHKIDPSIALGDAGLLVVVGALLSWAALVAVTGTRKYQYQWTNHLQPAFYVASLMLLALPLTLLSFMVLDTQRGWGLTKPKVFRLEISAGDFRSRLSGWAEKTGYDTNLNASGGRSGINYDSLLLTPSSSLDRWQYGLEYIHRPLPSLSVTYLASNDQPGKQAAIVVETPWETLDSPEETAFRSLVENLHAALEGKQYQRYYPAGNSDLSLGPLAIACGATGVLGIIAWGIVYLVRLSETDDQTVIPESKPGELHADELQRIEELSEKAPDWYCYPIMAIFALGWVTLALLWNLRWPGLWVAIGVLASITYYVVQLKLRYLPKLRSELEREPRWSRYSSLASALLMFVLGVLCVVWFQASLGDLFSRMQMLGGPRGLGFARMTDSQRSAILETAHFAALTDGKAEMFSGGFGITGSWIVVLLSALWAVTFLFFSVTTLIHTRRYRYTWKHWWQPSIAVTFYLLGMLMMVHGIHLFAVGHAEGSAERRAIRCDASWETVDAALDNWKQRNDYKQTSYENWIIKKEDSQVGTMHDRQLIPDSWFDRYQASWRYMVVRPRPQLSLTVVSQQEPPQTFIDVQLPHQTKGSPEAAMWTELVDDLEAEFVSAAGKTASAQQDSESEQISGSSSQNKPTSVEALEGVMSLPLVGESGSRGVLLSPKSTLEDIRELLSTLRDAHLEFRLHDTAYPSPSDPGAYVTYSYQDAKPECWSMTLGNHGWSGGIYQIEEETIAVQVFDLLKKGELTALQIENCHFAANKKQETEERSRQMNEELQSLHR